MKDREVAEEIVAENIQNPILKSAIDSKIQYLNELQTEKNQEETHTKIYHNQIYKVIKGKSEK